jgi:exoribonuclease R
VPQRRFRLTAPDGAAIAASFATLRESMEVSLRFPTDVLEDAERAIAEPRWPERDATSVPFVTIDPPASLDLDQALHLERRGDGYRVRYAIADVAAFVTPGEAMDRESHVRGQTLYAPDENARLYPRQLSEGAGSLLPDHTRSALVWDMEVDDTGEGIAVTVARALVRSRAKLDYEGVQAALDGGNASEPLRLLREVGELRQAREERRGGVQLPVPEQVVERTPEGYRLGFRAPLPIERWNAQLSLMTGMAAAELMLEAGIGVLRTLPEADERAVARLRRTAEALGVAWHEDEPYPEFLRRLDAHVSEDAAVLSEATVLLRGASYVAFDGSSPKEAVHSGVASTYAHTTAPLRRLVDRYVGEVCLAISAGEDVPDWARAALPELPETMEQSTRRAHQYEGGIVSAVEAAVLERSVGDTFAAVVVEVDDDEDGGGVVQLREPAVTARCTGRLPLGEQVEVRLEVADVMQRLVRFSLA